MQIDYKRDVSHTYLILQHEGEPDTNSYQVRMLLANTIPGLLPCRIGRMDMHALFYFEITSRQSLLSIYEYRPVDGQTLKRLFGQLMELLEEIGKYLLPADGILLLPELIFTDAELSTFSFCYLPCMQSEAPGFQQGLQNLMEYLLPKLNHQDPVAVVLGYGLYREVTSGIFSIEEFQNVLHQRKQENIPADDLGIGEPAGRKENGRGESKRDESPLSAWETGGLDSEDLEPERERENFSGENPERFSLHEEERPEWPYRYLAVSILILVCCGAAWILYRLEAAWFWCLLPLLAGAVLLGACEGIRFLRKRRRTDAPAGKRETEPDDSLPPEYHVPVQPSPERYGRIRLEKEYQVPDEGAEEDVSEKTELLTEGDQSSARLVPLDPPDMPVIALQRDSMLIGKLAAAADVVLPYRTVSRLHARIRREQEEYLISDMNSRNGTYVNGEALKGEEVRRLEEGDEIAFADRRYIFHR